MVIDDSLRSLVDLVEATPPSDTDTPDAVRVRHALTYLDDIKAQFTDDPRPYFDFLHIMDDYAQKR